MGQVVTTESWGKRLGGALKGIVFGFVIFVVAFPLLFWNEGRTIKRYKALREGAASTVAADSATVDAANEGRLVYMTGKAETEDILSDDEFQVSATAIQLRRIVEMYQWQEQADTETENQLGGSEKKTTTYSYKADWSNHLIDSSSFHEAERRNPSSMPYESKEWHAKNVTFGAFRLTESQIGRVHKFEPLKVEKLPEVPVDAAALTPEAKPADAPAPTPEAKPADAPAPTPEAKPMEKPVFEPLPPLSESTSEVTTTPTAPPPGTFSTDTFSVEMSTDTLDLTNPPEAEKSSAIVVNTVMPSKPTMQLAVPGMKLYQGGFYLGKIPSAPAVGDLRIRYEVVLPTDISLVAQQKGDSFVSYQAATGKIDLLEMGTVSQEAIYASAQASNTMLAWILRIIGFSLMFLGLCSIFKPLTVVADVVPFLGSLLGAGIGVVAFLLALVCSTVTIAIAWLFFRPVLGITLLVVAAVLLILLGGRMKKKEA